MRGGELSLSVFYWHQIFAVDTVNVKTHKLFSSNGGFLTNTMLQRNNLLRLTHFDEKGKWLMTDR